LFQAAVQDKDVELLVDYDVHLPVRFIGDPGRVRQVLTNLIGNAVKFTAAGHVLTRVSGLVDGASGEVRVQVTIEDTGPGIAADMMDHIFGEFNQVEDEKNRNFEGTGLGLAITLQLVELMGGKVWVDSEPGKGSSFGFHITMAAPDGAVREPRAMPGWVSRMVMVAQGDAALEVLCRQVAAVGPEVVIRSPAEMLAGADILAGDIVVVDGADGGGWAQVVRDLAERGTGVPVFVVRPADDAGPEFGASFVTPVAGAVSRKTLTAAVLAIPAPGDAVADDEPARGVATPADDVVQGVESPDGSAGSGGLPGPGLVTDAAAAGAKAADAKVTDDGTAQSEAVADVAPADDEVLVGEISDGGGSSGGLPGFGLVTDVAATEVAAADTVVTDAKTAGAKAADAAAEDGVPADGTAVQDTPRSENPAAPALSVVAAPDKVQARAGSVEIAEVREQDVTGADRGGVQA
ncbi:MAG: ATP-binding protein, partial [Paracoccaceae bacterium]